MLSDLELTVFLLFDWLQSVIDIREQFPLRTKDTDEIYKDFGIRQNKPNNVSQVLSTDFLIDFNDKNKTPKIAIQAKYSEDLKNPKTIQRLVIEYEYWKIKKIPWFIITEKNISKTMFNNIQWMYQSHKNEKDMDQMEHYYDLFSYQFSQHPNKIISEIAQTIDISHQQENGFSFYWLRQLMSMRFFTFDIHKNFQTLRSKDIILNQNIVFQQEENYVAY